MNLAYITIDLKRQLRDLSNLMFVLALPVVMYLLFGTQSEASQTAGHGNVAFYVLTAMALYGAALATASISGTAATESMLGWGRQVALTRQPRIGFVVNKVVVAATVAMIAIMLVYSVGAGTGAQADRPQIWLATFAITLALTCMWAIYGLAVGLLFRSETAVSIASGALTFFAFFGNLFIPLHGTLLEVARFTPMYGAAGLVHWPLTEGRTVDGGQDSLGLLLVNVGVWTAIFLALAVQGVRRSTTRK